ncbi:MAG: helix-turn-helix transcriptional regulator [Actinomycetota bacterium]|nr:helix-turn-helix transcriptional regulator [Actinomycetota bacterium]
MSRSYDQANAERRSRLTGAAKAQQEVFARTYSLAMQVVELRERRGLTQEDLAKRTGIDQGDISRIERGASNPTERTLLRIGDALGAELRFVERTSA